MKILAWVLILFGLLVGIPLMLVFPPIGIVFMAIAYGGYVLRRKTRGIAMRRQQGRSWLARIIHRVDDFGVAAVA